MTRSRHIFQLLFLFSILCTAHTGAQGYLIRGLVTDNEGVGIAGATISDKDAGLIAITDSIGRYTIELNDRDQFLLTISALGFEPAELCMGCDTVITWIITRLDQHPIALKEVSIHHDKKQWLWRTESISINLINEEFIKETRASTLVQTLSRLPGVHAMDIGSGLSKPMIRGMGFYRIVMAENGIKQEGQQWSHHHSITIDQYRVSHVEVTKGPAALQYGSDAIGGAINILSTHVPLVQGLSGEFSLEGKTNNWWGGTSASLTCRKGDIYLKTFFTHNQFADLRIPTTEWYLLPAPVSAIEASHHVPLGNVIYNTAGVGTALTIVTGMVRPWGNSYLELTTISNKMGFFDWEGLRNSSTRQQHTLNTRDILDPRQQITDGSIRYFLNRYNGNNKMEFALGYQHNLAEEFNQLTDITGNRPEEVAYYRGQDGLELSLALHTLSNNLTYTAHSFGNHVIKIGLATQYQHHLKEGFYHILPEYQRLTTGMFITDSYTLSDKWTVNSGIRGDLCFFRMTESLNPDPAFGDTVFNPFLGKTYPGIGFSAGANYLLAQHLILKINLGKSFRTPSAYELGAYGLHRHNGRFEKGVINHRSEQAWQVDVGLEGRWENLQLSVTPFITYFQNYLYLKPTPLLRPHEGQVYEYSQTRALLAGGELLINWQPNKKTELKLASDYVYAVNTDLRMALPFTPPMTALIEYNYLFSHRNQGKTKVGVEVQIAAPQYLTVPNEPETPGYSIFNLKASTDIKVGKSKATMMLRVRNLLNTSYFNHISFYRRLRIPEPGRDIQFFLTLPFQSIPQSINP